MTLGGKCLVFIQIDFEIDFSFKTFVFCLVWKQFFYYEAYRSNLYYDAKMSLCVLSNIKSIYDINKSPPKFPGNREI